MPAVKPDTHIVADAKALSWAAAEEFVRQAREAVRARGVFTVALSGGSTPKSLYTLLASEDGASFRAQLPWDNIHVFWGDERHVPPDHPDSNYRMAHEAMLAKVPLPAANVHRIKTENPDARQAADAYEQELCAFFRLAPTQLPSFNLVLLGMGPDGHTASLFPGTSVVHELTRLTTAPWVEQFQSYRVTLTPPVLNNAACVIFLVSGEDKAATLREVLEGDYQPDRFPSQVIRPTRGRLLWLVDRAAAGLLRRAG